MHAELVQSSICVGVVDAPADSPLLVGPALAQVPASGFGASYHDMQQGSGFVTTDINRHLTEESLSPEVHQTMMSKAAWQCHTDPLVAACCAGMCCADRPSAAAGLCQHPEEALKATDPQGSLLTGTAQLPQISCKAH